MLGVLMPQAAVWSQDNVVGSFDAATGTWTPGFGSDGRVTAVSWAQVPTGQWVKVAGTRMDVLDAAVKARVPGWRDVGTGKWDGVVGAWSGMAVDPTAPRAWFFGGGHHDSANNGLYRFDFNRMKWEIEILPTDPAKFDARYTTSGTGSFTIYPPADDYSKANPTDYSVSYDCFWPFEPNTPTARHTYGSMVYNPARNELMMWCRRTWIADLSSGTWRVYNPHAQHGPNASGGENMFCFYDGARQRLVLNCTQYQNQGRNMEFDPISKNFYVSQVALPASDTAWTFASCHYGNRVYAFMRPDVIRPGTVFVYDLPSNTRTEVRLSGPAATDTFQNYYDGGASAYVPEVGKLLVATYSDSAKTLRLYWCDPMTGDVQYANIPGPWDGTHILPETKMQYIPHLRAVAHMSRASQEWRILRMA
ncbi:hypothetical protein [Uliginosibacterium sp. H1]|uniref:hypothetical protein n=1 Tax=Uliginosibacterium sp. H1 TaxID=3114757 RepID=UPI002E1850FD|nr:hypothetical protein [Uliginosibacterium sp. H1]